MREAAQPTRGVRPLTRHLRSGTSTTALPSPAQAPAYHAALARRPCPQTDPAARGAKSPWQQQRAVAGAAARRSLCTYRPVVTQNVLSLLHRRSRTQRTRVRASARCSARTLHDRRLDVQRVRPLGRAWGCGRPRRGSARPGAIQKASASARVPHTRRRCSRAGAARPCKWQSAPPFHCSQARSRSSSRSHRGGQRCRLQAAPASTNRSEFVTRLGRGGGEPAAPCPRPCWAASCGPR